MLGGTCATQWITQTGQARPARINHSRCMSEREEIKARVESFRKHQERLCAERNTRMDQLAQQIRETLSDMHARDSASGVARRYWPTPT